METVENFEKYYEPFIKEWLSGAVNNRTKFTKFISHGFVDRIVIEIDNCTIYLDCIDKAIKWDSTDSTHGESSKIHFFRDGKYVATFYDNGTFEIFEGGFKTNGE